MCHFVQTADALDMGGEEVEEEADEMYAGVLNEIGLEYQVDGPVRTRMRKQLSKQIVGEGKGRRAEGARGNKAGGMPRDSECKINLCCFV